MVKLAQAHFCRQLPKSGTFLSIMSEFPMGSSFLLWSVMQPTGCPKVGDITWTANVHILEINEMLIDMSATA